MRDIRAENNKHNQPQPPPHHHHHHHHHHNNNKIVRGWMRKVYSMRQGEKENEDGGGGWGWGVGGMLLMLHFVRLSTVNISSSFSTGGGLYSFLPSFSPSGAIIASIYGAPIRQYHPVPPLLISSTTTTASTFQCHNCQYLPVPVSPVSSGASIASILSIWLLYNYALLL